MHYPRLKKKLTHLDIGSLRELFIQKYLLFMKMDLNSPLFEKKLLFKHTTYHPVKNVS